jgi:hypothetical protein
MIDVLKDDWNNRSPGELGTSLILKYLRLESETIGGEKRVVRAIFADGSKRALGEFKEIWKNETRERKVPAGPGVVKKTRTKINIDEGQYGDYMDDQSSDLEEEEEEPTTQGVTFTSGAEAPDVFVDGSLLLGGALALKLRLQLLGLLSVVSAQCPGTPIPLSDLYELYLASIRPLPLPTFVQILSPPALKAFPLSEASSLVQYIASTLLESAAPVPTDNGLSHDILEQCFLPWASNTTEVTDNAKVGFCIETLLRMFDTAVGLRWSKELEQRVEDGIKRREEKAKKAGKRSAGGGTVEVERGFLQRSGQRMREVVQMAKGRRIADQ